jgi:hypothetical protein
MNRSSSGFSGSRRIKSRQKTVAEHLRKFANMPLLGLAGAFEDLAPFVPDFTAAILEEIYPKIVNLLQMGNVPPEAEGKMMDFLLKMMKEADPSDSESDPFPKLYSSPEFLSGLFMHMTVDEHGEFDDRVITMFSDYLLVKEPGKIVTFLSESKDPMVSFLREMTKSKNKRAAILCNQFLVCHSSVKASLINDIRPLLKNFPPRLLVDLMISTAELKQLIPEADFEDWLLHQEVLDMSDLQLIVESLYPSLWSRILCVKLILRTPPAEKWCFVEWIHRREPQSFEGGEELAKEVEENLLKPDHQFNVVKEDEYGKVLINTRDTYLFTRLYVLSLTDPRFVSSEGVELVYRLCCGEEVHVAAGALQTLAIWIAQFGFVPDSTRIYGLAKEIDVNEPLSNLYRIVLMLFAQSDAVSAGVLMAEGSLRFNSANKVRVMRMQWVFPHLVRIFEIDFFKNISDQQVGLGLLGEVSNYLGLTVDA